MVTSSLTIYPPPPNTLFFANPNTPIPNDSYTDKNRFRATVTNGPTLAVPGRLTQNDVQHLFVTANGSTGTAAREALRQKHRVPISLYKNLLCHYRTPTLKTDKEGHQYAVGIWDND